MSTHQFRRQRAAAVDGRAHSIYFRQAQLERLCRGLLAEETALRQAMTADESYTTGEAIVVYHASVEAVKRAYANLQPQRALADEYRIARGADALDNVRPFGLIYIEPEAHTLLYSICSPLCAAIAAGNCVVLLLENNLRQLPQLIRRILADALDGDLFGVTSSPIKDETILNSCMAVRPRTFMPHPRSNELVSSSSATAIATVDRTADTEVAAKELMQSRSAFGGKSPYAPSIVLVNEFVIDNFLDAIKASCGLDVSERSQKDAFTAPNSARLLSFDFRNGEIAQGPGGLDRVINLKSTDSILYIQPVSSLDDAINVAGASQTAPYLAAYHFCNLPSGKYLSQFVDAEVTFINHIPARILVGPASPTPHPFNLGHRYTLAQFSRPSPAFVEPSSRDRALSVVLGSRDHASAQKLLQEANKPLAAMKRSQGGGVGFFEQGFLMNASFILVSVITLSATGAWSLWKYRSGR